MKVSLEHAESGTIVTAEKTIIVPHDDSMKNYHELKTVKVQRIFRFESEAWQYAKEMWERSKEDLEHTIPEEGES